MEYYLKVFYGRPNKIARSEFIRADFRRKKEGKTNKFDPKRITGERGNWFDERRTKIFLFPLTSRTTPKKNPPLWVDFYFTSPDHFPNHRKGLPAIGIPHSIIQNRLLPTWPVRQRCPGSQPNKSAQGWLFPSLPQLKAVLPGEMEGGRGTFPARRSS